MHNLFFQTITIKSQTPKKEPNRIYGIRTFRHPHPSFFIVL